MTSKYKAALTENIQLLSSEENIEAKAQPSSQSQKMDNMPTSTQTTKARSASTSNADNKTAVNALMLRAALLSLEKAGLLKRYKVLSKSDATGLPVVKEIRVVLDPSIWSEDFRLHVG